MVGMWVVLIFLWLLLLVLAPPQSLGCRMTTADTSYNSSAVARGYNYGYNQVAPYPFIPFLEPLVILAALGFLAYLVQTFHALYLSQQTTYSAHNPSLVGGIVSSIVPTKHRTLPNDADRLNDILSAIRLYKKMYKKRESENERHEVEERIINGNNTTRSTRHLRRRRR